MREVPRKFSEVSGVACAMREFIRSVVFLFCYLELVEAQRTYIEIRCLGRRQIVWTTTTTTTSFDCCSLLFDRVTSESHPALAPIHRRTTWTVAANHVVFVACADEVLRSDAQSI